MTRQARLSIGEVSRRSRLPVPTLRYYHEIGLLEPAEVDRRSGYRRYDVDQVATAVLIAELRAAGLGPATIATLVGAGEERPSATWAAARALLAARVDEERANLARFDAIVAQRDLPAVEPVRVRELCVDRLVEERFACSVDEIPWRLRRVFARLRSRARRVSEDDGATMLTAIFPLDLTAERIEISAVVEARSPTPRRPSPLAVAATVHCGARPSLWVAYEALLEYVEREALPLGSTVIERYLPDDTGRPTTEVAVELAAAPPTMPRSAASSDADRVGRAKR